MKRTKLSQRALPAYTRGEELANMLTHILGALIGITALLSCVLRSSLRANGWGIVSCAIYGSSMLLVFTISSVYHGMRPNLGKKVLQVIDHCTIYFLIAGTYTPVLLCGLRPQYPGIAWTLFGIEWGMAALATVFTAIDLHNYRVFSMICYLVLGWAVIPFWRQTMEVLGSAGFTLLLLGGIAYTVGSILYGLGKNRKWMHSIFHVFVVLGAVLQWLCIFLYVL